MLRLRQDRQDYEQLLAPPPGYETEFAVGTTYSLDMQALLGVCLALGLSASVDHTPQDAPMLSFEAIRRMMDKLLVFYDAAQLKAPAKGNQLFVLMEKIVFDVALPNRYAFHPKMWVVKYSDPSGNSFYRCVVMSRNLTFDRSWDVAACLEGSTGEFSVVNTPLIDFLDELNKLGKEKYALISKLAALQNLNKDLRNVQFNLDSSQFSSYQFCPFGIPNHGIVQSELFNKCHQMLVISPFLSSSVVDTLGNATRGWKNKSILISRKDELWKLKRESARKFDFYSVSDKVNDGESAISEGDESNAKPQDIHAKLYFKENSSNDRDLYLGSLNASNNACNGNMELLLKLKSTNSSVTMNTLKRDLFQENEIFQFETLSEQVGEAEDTGPDLAESIKEICFSSQIASVSCEEDIYTVQVKFSPYSKQDNSIKITVSPFLRCDLVQDYAPSLAFQRLTLAELSEFYILEARQIQDDGKHMRRLLKISTANMPIERDKEIVNNIIKDRDHFNLLIGYILGDHVSVYDSGDIEPGSPGNSGWQALMIPGIYEKMLRAASREPKKIDEIRGLLDLVKDENKIPEGFKTLFEKLYKVVLNERK